MKCILIIVLICVIMLIAHSLSEQYRMKFDFYSNFKTFLIQFKLNLNFKQAKICDFLNHTSSKKQFNSFIEAYKTYLKTGDLDLSGIKILDEEERSHLEDIVKSIGKLDIRNELNQIEIYISEVDDRLKKAENDKNRLCPMILKLSLLFAIGLAVLLI